MPIYRGHFSNDRTARTCQWIYTQNENRAFSEVHGFVTCLVFHDKNVPTWSFTEAMDDETTDWSMTAPLTAKLYLWFG